MIQIVKLTYNDDNLGSIDAEVMPCASINTAKEIVLNEVNKIFEYNFKSLVEAVKKLSSDIDASWDEESKTFSWADNGKGETYIICKINERELNTKFQRIGRIL